jgi:hypothetical protein
MGSERWRCILRRVLVPAAADSIVRRNLQQNFDDYHCDNHNPHARITNHFFPLGFWQLRDR